MEYISKNRYSLKQIFAENWEKFLKEYKDLVRWYMAYNVWKVVNCREPNGLGFFVFACPTHIEETCIVPCSCKSRFCSICGKIQTDKWIQKMNAEFPECNYYHVTFSLPSQFRALLFENPHLLNAVFPACAETLISYGKEQGFLLGITSVLHTFGSDLKRHVHIHCIVTAGGLLLDQKQERYTRIIKRKKKNGKIKIKKVTVVEDQAKWVECSFFPYKLLHKRFQGILIEKLKEAVLDNKENDPELALFTDPNVMKSFFDDLKEKYEKGFYVNVSEERIELKPTMDYLGKYARRPPISEVRIKKYDGERITFEYKDYYDKGTKVDYELSVIEFIRKLIRHIPPHYFNITRHYGLFASRVKTKYKKILNKVLNTTTKTMEKIKKWEERQMQLLGINPMICKICKRKMEYLGKRLLAPLFVVREHFQKKFCS